MAPSGAATKQPDLQTAKRCFQGRIVRKKFGSHGVFQGACPWVECDRFLFI
jgi:hypothetical protein